MKVLALLCCLAAACAVVSAVDVDHLPSNILAPRFAEADAGLTATTTVKAFGKCKALLQKMVQDNGYAGKGGHIYMWHFTDWDTDKVKVGATYSEARTGHIRMTEDSGKLINKKTAELIADIEVKDAQVAENKWKELYPADGNPKKISVPHKKKMNGYTEWYKLGTASPAAALALVKGVVAAKCGDGKAGGAGVIYLWHFAVNNPNNWKVGLSSKADAVDRAYAESRGTGEEAADVQTIPCNDFNGAEDAWKAAKADIRYQNTDMSQPMDGYTEWWDCSLTV